MKFVNINDHPNKEDIIEIRDIVEQANTEIMEFLF